MATKTCEHCGATYSRPPALLGKFCSPECGRIGRRKAAKDLKATYRMVNRAGHPIAPPSGLLPEHRVLLYDKIGPGTHPCHWCKEPVEWRTGVGPRKGALVVDHLDADPKNNDPANLVPACQRCNGTRNNPIRLREGEIFLVRPNGERLRGLNRFCNQCGAAFIARDAEHRFCSRSCGVKNQHAMRGHRLTS